MVNATPNNTPTPTSPVNPVTTPTPIDTTVNQDISAASIGADIFSGDTTATNITTPVDTTANQNITPTPVEAPITPVITPTNPNPTPTPANPTTTTPKITPKITPKTPTINIKPPVENIQDTKAKTLDNQVKEDGIKVTKDTNTVNSFNQAITSGNLDIATNIAIKNPELKDTFNSAIKAHFTNKANVDFFKQYNGMSNIDMETAVKSGELVPGSERYNLLPPDQKDRFKQYQTEKAVIETKKPFDSAPGNKVLSLTDFVTQMKEIFSTNLRTKAKDLLNSDAINTEVKGLETLKNQINAEDDNLKSMEDNVRKEYPGASEFQIRSIIRNRSKDILRSKNTFINQYNAKLGTYQSLKDNAKTEINLLKYEDAQNKQIYTTALKLYEGRRKETRADILTADKFTRDTETRKFLAENKKLAADTKFQRTLAIKEFDANLRKEDKGGIYKVDRQGREVYMKNGVSTFVRSTEGDILYTKDNKTFSDTIVKENGIYTTIRAYKDGRKPEYFTHDVTGKRSDNGNNVVDTLISNIASDNLQCGEAVNKYVVGQLGVSSKDFWLGDTYASKKKFINDSLPKVGGVAIWNNTNKADGKYAEFGHTGIVTGYNKENGTVQITDWNWNGDKKKSTHSVKISEITGSDGGFYNPNSIPKAVGFDTPDTPLYTKFLAGKLTSSDQKNIKDFETFKAKAELYKNDLILQGTPQIEKLIKLARDLRDNAPGRLNRIAAGVGGDFVSGDLADYGANFDAFISNNALDNLISLKNNGAKFGALSDSELEFIQTAATNLRPTLSDKAFKGELNRIITSLQKGLSTKTKERINGALDIPTVAEANNIAGTTGSLFDFTKKNIDTTDFNTLLNK